MTELETETKRLENEEAEAIFEERRTSRGSFLRRLGLTLAVGLGGGLAFARPAWASAHCCFNPTYCSGLTCPTGQRPFKCVDCDGTVCCQCLPYEQDCVGQLGCGGCGP